MWPLVFVVYEQPKDDNKARLIEVTMTQKAVLFLVKKSTTPVYHICGAVNPFFQIIEDPDLNYDQTLKTRPSETIMNYIIKSTL